MRACAQKKAAALATQAEKFEDMLVKEYKRYEEKSQECVQEVGGQGAGAGAASV